MEEQRDGGRDVAREGHHPRRVRLDADVLTPWGDKLFFVANGGGQMEPWLSDGSEGGTFELKNISPGGSSNPSSITPAGERLYFAANDGSATGLYVTDGTTGGTRLIINPTGYFLNGSNISNLVNVNGTAFFSANNSTNGQELWKSDGTADGTEMVLDITPGGGGTNYSQFTPGTSE